MLIPVMRKKKSRKGKKRNISKAQLNSEKLQALYKKYSFLGPQTGIVYVGNVSRDGYIWADTKTHSFQEFDSSSFKAASEKLKRFGE